MITDHKPSVEVVSKDVTALPLWLQCIMLYIHQNNMCILYKPGPDLYIADCLSHHNHTEGKDQEVAYEHQHTNTQASNRHPGMHVSRGHKKCNGYRHSCRGYRHTE